MAIFYQTEIEVDCRKRINMKITIPKLSLVVLIGPSGSGKSTFARKHFLPTEVLSSDSCRGMVSDDENNQAATNEAFELLHFIAAKRLALGRLTVVDATNVQPEARKPLVELARKYHCLPVAIVLNLPERLCQDRNRARADETSARTSSASSTRSSAARFVAWSGKASAMCSCWKAPKRSKRPRSSGCRCGTTSGRNTARSTSSATFTAAATNWKPCSSNSATSVDIAGGRSASGATGLRHPEGRKAVFVGDLVDRGPRILDTVRLVRNMVVGGTALCVPGNHDMKLMRKLRGKDVQITHGLANRLAEIDALPDEVRDAVLQGTGRVPRRPGQPLRPR